MACAAHGSCAALRRLRQSIPTLPHRYGVPALHSALPLASVFLQLLYAAPADRPIAPDRPKTRPQLLVS
jgi:hypothetical protein